MAARWGTFLQQAVAGVESRLDNILGETEEIPKPDTSGASTPAAAPIKPDSGMYFALFSGSWYSELTFQYSTSAQTGWRQQSIE